VSVGFLVGVGAWLLGAAAATGGSLLAVSALGQGLAPAPSQQLTEIAVSRALASEAVEATPPPPSPQPVVSTSATPLVPHVKKHSAAKKPSVPPSSPAPPPTDTVLISIGGTVMADCQAAGAYVASWSPAQGYEAAPVIRGPAATAKVRFTSSRKLVTMTISCSGGTPSTATTVTNRPDE
jgi:serine/threonine-protein kinase